MFGICLECDEMFEIEENTDVGDYCQCPKCSSRFEVLDLHPVVLDYP